MSAARKKDRPRQDALELLRFWYGNRCKDGTQRYTFDGTEITITAEPGSRQSFGPKRDPLKTVTADGKQTRVGNPEVLGSYPYGPKTDPFARFGPYGSHRRKVYERYARECMSRIWELQPTVHKALEMHAATWPAERVAEELNVGVHKARTLVECGLIAIALYRYMAKPAP